MAVSLIIRGLFALDTELGIDEVYYLTYARYPDLSHFDHPPFVGLLIQLSTFNLKFSSELAIRFFPLLLGTFNIFLIFKIISGLANERAGLIGALMFSGSIYASLIAGVFIMPDSAMMTFILAAIWSMCAIVVSEARVRIYWIYFGIFVGMAMLSKVHSGFLWLGMILFILSKRPNWLTRMNLYLGGILTVAVISPIIVWNLQNDFASFAFHSNRVNEIREFHFDYLLQEILGGILYNGPFNWFMIVIAVSYMIRRRFAVSSSIDRLFLLTTLPLILVFIGVACWNKTLPHWSAPAFTLLIIPTAIFAERRMRRALILSLASVVLFIVAALIGDYVINNYSMADNAERIEKVGRKDFTLDMFGWKQAGDEFRELKVQLETEGRIQKDIPIIITRWFPGAHIDHYIARTYGSEVRAIGDLDDLHKYAWIEKDKAPLTKGGEAIFITTSHLYTDPMEQKSFTQQELLATIPIYKNGVIVEYFFVYKVSVVC
jgi:4-amino-4-deoxy-L-arabinose transferase-like glycosyltransferase